MNSTPEKPNHFANNVGASPEDPNEEAPESNEKYYIYSIIGVIVAFVAPIIGLIISLIVLKISDESDGRTRRLAMVGSLAGGILFIATIVTLLFFGSKY
jgi:fumarate reductase subunit D